MIRAGQRLQEERLSKGLSLDDVARATKIRVSFLQAIEKGDYQKLPSSAYVRGFVRNYAEYLGLSKRDILALFRREFDEEQVFRVLPESMSKKEDFPLRRVRMGQTIFGILSVVAILALYILYQYRFAFLNPPLTVLTPKEHAVVTDSQVVVSGQSDVHASIFVDDQPVVLDSDGAFKKALDVLPGDTTIRVVAKNRFGRQTGIERHIRVKNGE